MQNLFNSYKITNFVEEPCTETALQHDQIIVNSLIRFDAISFVCAQKIPFLQFVHEDWAPSDFIGGIHPDWGWYLPIWEDLQDNIGQAKSIVFPAKYLASHYSSYNTSVIYNPVNGESLTGIKRMETHSKKLDIINIGTINRRKNQGMIIDYCVNSNDVESARFFGLRTIRDHETEYAQNLMKKAASNPHCRFEFNETHFPLSFKFSDKTIFALTSIGEVLPCTIQEMMHIGIPVVAPAMFGIPEIINPEKTGMLYTPNDMSSLSNAINLAYSRRSSISKAAKAFSEENFSLNRQSKKLLDLLEI
ncbi:glycosyltransferase [Pseudomaricurvus sp. HS19]|uniref:glycosyltransferase n=1 Tax=Pseudomaricurvus sp. HS19 TaxID=2692626 RepID=UPI001370D1C7|nr:glycosyltransferase [Pseudomaricurvus sp. HS19]MYM62857.1 glycosyltransferase [Pseudomaricurvus sp. HS19]